MSDRTAAAAAASGASGPSSRRNTESAADAGSKIEVVQIDGLVVMKLIKHCHEVDSAAGQGGIAQVRTFNYLRGRKRCCKSKKKRCGKTGTLSEEVLIFHGTP